jgi:hypothetical protein
MSSTLRYGNNAVSATEEWIPIIRKRRWMPPQKNSETEAIDQQSSGANRRNEDGKDIYLVDWYGPEDPEVLLSLASPVAF